MQAGSGRQEAPRQAGRVCTQQHVDGRGTRSEVSQGELEQGKWEGIEHRGHVSTQTDTVTVMPTALSLCPSGLI